MLRAGEYEYRLVVDDQWIEDPEAEQRKANPHGGSIRFSGCLWPFGRPFCEYFANLCSSVAFFVIVFRETHGHLRPVSLPLFVFRFDLFTNGCKKKPAPPPPPEVQVITLAPTNVPIFEEWIGTLDGYVNAQIHAQVTGYLLTQN